MAEKYADIVSEISGNIPFILTVRDDGYFDTLDGKNILPLVKHPKENDAGTRRLGFLIVHGGETFHPFLMLQNVERKRMIKSIRMHFYNRVLERARECLERWGECYILDLHATAKQPAFGIFDIIFGTNHGKTVINNFDAHFAALLEAGGALKVYVPMAEETPGEIWKASLGSTLANWIKNQEPRVSAIQMEIAKSWFENDARIAVMALEIYTAIVSAV